MKFNKSKMWSFIILAVLRSMLLQVSGLFSYHCTCGQHSFFGRNIATDASRREHGLRFDLPEICFSDLRSSNECIDVNDC